MAKMKKKSNLNKLNVFLLIILFASVIFSIYLFFQYQNARNEIIFIKGLNESINYSENNTNCMPTKILYNCTTDSDCVWMSTNCCSENSGAYWECVNKKSYIDCCSKLVLCPQVLSPKPKTPCKCIGGKCVA